MHTQREALVAQLALEKQHLTAFPQEEASELAAYLQSHLGVSERTAATVIREIQSSPDALGKMLELHAKCGCARAQRWRCACVCQRVG